MNSFFGNLSGIPFHGSYKRGKILVHKCFMCTLSMGWALVGPLKLSRSLWELALTCLTFSWIPPILLGTTSELERVSLGEKLLENEQPRTSVMQFMLIWRESSRKAPEDAETSFKRIKDNWMKTLSIIVIMGFLTSIRLILSIFWIVTIMKQLAWSHLHSYPWSWWNFSLSEQ